MSFRKLLPLILVLAGSVASAQVKNLYNYQDLSHFYYEKQKDSLKKAWSCPDAFRDRATQKEYRELWDRRTNSVIGALTDNDYVHDREVYSYVDDIVRQLVDANKTMIPVKPLLLIDRSPAINAYSTGGNVLAVNVGIIAFASCREELALIIAHELSHNILHHVETSIYLRAQWLGSDDYKKSLNAVLDSKYDRFSRLSKVVQGYTFSRNRHDRYLETDADSLAVILLKKTNIPFNARFFLRLDSSDMQPKQPLHHPLKDYFAAWKLPYEDAWAQRRSKGLSSRAYAFTDTTSIADSLKTHPDCLIRYNRTKALSVATARQTPIPAPIVEKVNKMIIWDLYSTTDLTECLYRILQLKDKGDKDPWYDFMAGNVFSGLYYADRELARFNAIGIVQKELISKDYYALQTMLEQIPRDNLKQYCQSMQTQAFWRSPDEKDLGALLGTLALDPDNSDKNKAWAARAFTSANANSMYCEFANNFEK
ncbi:M48 family metalloprotease [Puia sp. P3]|uniref:M48 family metalloprotease n=1 Tax=Puia sp. P3 TaxID=3423952 RepID=UPI003D6764D2